MEFIPWDCCVLLECWILTVAFDVVDQQMFPNLMSSSNGSTSELDETNIGFHTDSNYDSLNSNFHESNCHITTRS